MILSQDDYGAATQGCVLNNNLFYVDNSVAWSNRCWKNASAVSRVSGMRACGELTRPKMIVFGGEADADPYRLESSSAYAPHRSRRASSHCRQSLPGDDALLTIQILEGLGISGQAASENKNRVLISPASEELFSTYLEQCRSALLRRAWWRIEREIERYSTFEKGWDSYNADPLSESCISSCRQLIKSLRSARANPSDSAITADSDLIIYCETHGKQTKWLIDSDGDIAVAVRPPGEDTVFHDVAVASIDSFLEKIRNE